MNRTTKVVLALALIVQVSRIAANQEAGEWVRNGITGSIDWVKSSAGVLKDACDANKVMGKIGAMIDGIWNKFGCGGKTYDECIASLPFAKRMALLIDFTAEMTQYPVRGLGCLGEIAERLMEASLKSGRLLLVGVLADRIDSNVGVMDVTKAAKELWIRSRSIEAARVILMELGQLEKWPDYMKPLPGTRYMLKVLDDLKEDTECVDDPIFTKVTYDHDANTGKGTYNNGSGDIEFDGEPVLITDPLIVEVSKYYACDYSAQTCGHDYTLSAQYSIARMMRLAFLICDGYPCTADCYFTGTCTMKEMDFDTATYAVGLDVLHAPPAVRQIGGTAQLRNSFSCPDPYAKLMFGGGFMVDDGFLERRVFRLIGYDTV
jgi:hypothetical protein